MQILPGLFKAVGCPDDCLLPEAVADHLKPYGKPLAAEAAGQGNPRQPRQVDGYRVDIPQVHLQRIGQALPQTRRRGGRCRSQDYVKAFKGFVKGLLDQGLDPQGLQIIGIVLAGA